MSLIKNILAFKNWPIFYAGRYGLLQREFEIRDRHGIRLKVRPHTDDLMIVKSNFVTRHYIRGFVPIGRDSIVVDVGAHIGSFSLIAARTARKVLAFEPEPSNYRMLKKNMELNDMKNLSIFEMAVSGASGYQSLSIYEESSTGNHSLFRTDSKKVVERRVETISLKEIMRKEGLSRVDFLKLDCEGAEHDILREMDPETAARIMGIAMETHRVPGDSSIDLSAALRRLGFEVRVEQDGGYLYARRTARSLPGEGVR